MTGAKAHAAIQGLLVFATVCLMAAEPQKNPRVTQAAASSCEEKIAALESFEAQADAGKTAITRITEEEFNSFLALRLSEHYHPSLRNLYCSFGPLRLQCTAAIDFDQIAVNSKSFSTRLLAGMLSGVHVLVVRGRLINGSGKAQFQLEEARFDDGQLPNFLVEEILSAVGRKQDPPIDPMQPSEMPYRIEKVDFHQGSIVVHQRAPAPGYRGTEK